MDVCEWRADGDSRDMAQLASALWPAGLHPGGLGWCLATDQLASRILLARGGGHLRGWAGVSPGELALQVHPGDSAAAAALMAAALADAPPGPLALVVWDQSPAAAEAAARAGFVPDSQSPALGMVRAAARHAPPLPPGYHVRPTRPDERAARVEVHRKSWRWSDLPWVPALRPAIAPDESTLFTDPHYDRVCRTWLYDPRLDLVVEAPDGTLAASCLGWWDPNTGTAEIEPLGVVPAHRRRGLAGALTLAVSDTVARWGGRQVFINTGPRADYPAPAAAYAAVGFRVIRRGQWHRRPDVRAPG